MDLRIPLPSGEVPSMLKKHHIPCEPRVPGITKDSLDNVIAPVLRERVFPILDHRLSYGKQKPHILESCKQHALAYFPIFEEYYVDAWPISVLARIYLYDFRRKLGQKGNRKRGDLTVLQIAIKKLKSPFNIPNAVALSPHEVVEFYTSLVNRRHTNLESVSADDFKLLLGALLNTCQVLEAAEQDVPDDVASFYAHDCNFVCEVCQDYRPSISLFSAHTLLHVIRDLELSVDNLTKVYVTVAFLTQSPSCRLRRLGAQCLLALQNEAPSPYPRGAIGSGLGAEQVVEIMVEADMNIQHQNELLKLLR